MPRERQRCYDDCMLIAERLKQMPRVLGEIVEPEGVDRVPRLRIAWDRWHYPIGGLELRRHLLDGEPRIMLDDNSASEDGIAIDPFQLQPGEAAQVGEAIAAALRGAAGAAPLDRHSSTVDIAGDWELRVDFLRGMRLHKLVLDQRGAELAGRHHSAQFEGPLSGWVDGDRVQLQFTSRYEANTLFYQFEGEVRDGAMSGTATLGAASDDSPGMLNRGQFGAARWRASRMT